MKRPGFSLMAAVSVIACAQRPALPQDDVGTLAPVRVSDGPLFFMVRPLEASSGETEVHLVVDPETGAIPREFLRVRGAATVLHRLDRNRLLLERIGVRRVPPAGLFVLEIDKGTARYLLPDADTQLVHREGMTVLFAESVEEGRWGYEIGPGPAGRERETWIVGYPQPKLRLHAYDAERGGPARAVRPELVERVLEVRAGGIYAVSSANPQELWCVSRDGKSRRKIIELDSRWIPAALTHEFSPSGKLLALGAGRKDHFFIERDLVVVDVEAGKRTFELPGVRVSLCPGASALPELVFTWLSEEEIRFSETKTRAPRNALTSEGHFQWVDLSLRTGVRLRETEYSEIGLWHEKPSRDSRVKRRPPRRWTHGRFVWEPPRLFFDGDRTPLLECGGPLAASIDGSISPDGRWAAFAALDDALSPCLADGEKRTTARLAKGWHRDFRWLPPARGR